MRHDDVDMGNSLKIVPETDSMDVPSACTIVIIAGKIEISWQDKNTFPFLGEYLDKVDRVMTQVDQITEDIDHMPVAAFIFRDMENDEAHFSTASR